MKVSIERSLKYLAVVVTIAFSAIFGVTAVNAAPSALEEAPANETGFGVLVLRGAVTGIDTDVLTIVDENNESFVANFDEYTVLFAVATQSEAELADVTEGDLVEVLGLENIDGDIDADFVSILPDGESIRGKVAELFGSTLIVSSGETDYAITTDDDTVFFLDGEVTGLSDILVDMNIQAFGEITAEGAVAADLVIAHQGVASGPIEADVSDLGRQRDDIELTDSEPAIPPGGYSVGRLRDVEVPAAAAVEPPGGYSVGRTRDP